MAGSGEPSGIRSFADVDFGDELPATLVDVRLETVKVFTDAAGMSFSRFNDHEKAREAGLPGAIVPGIMSQGILAAMVNNWAPGATIIKIDTIFRAALVVDSSPTCAGVVTDLDEEAQTAEIDLTITNEAGETRVMGTAVVKF
jgi:acyl dehydratase